MQSVQIPQYVDEPVHLLIWQIDEVAPIILGLLVGIFAGAPGAFLLGGLGLSYVYRKVRDTSSDGLALHWLYWHGFIPNGSRTVPNAHSRLYLP